MLLVWRHPPLWLFGLPALLPVLDFSPWTGWIAFEEFDLLVLGSVAVGWARLALDDARHDGDARRAHIDPVVALGVALALLTCIGLARGFEDAGGWRFGWFDGHVDPLNAWRVGKSVVFALLLAPLLAIEMRRGEAVALRRFALGMLTGVALVALASLWERAAYPGVWDFTRRYRTTALFWEMHVGGAAIDGYLALGAPFVMWAVWAARTPLRWAAASVLALLAGYATLATFSRGLYAAVVVSCIGLGLAAAARRARRGDVSTAASVASFGDAALVAAALLLVTIVFEQHGAGVAGLIALATLSAVLALRRLHPVGWRAPAGMALALAFAIEVALAFGPGSFMLNRLAASERDSGSRWEHWRAAAGLLATPNEWAWGIGLGRFPARYAASEGGAEFAGSVTLLDGAALASAPAGIGPRVRLTGPSRDDDLGGLFALTQRIAAQPHYRLEFDVRAEPGAQVYAKVCDQHLIYPMRCHRSVLVLDAPGGSWHHQAMVLIGPGMPPPGHFPPRETVFSLSVSSAGGVAEFSRLNLTGRDAANLLSNADFTRGLAGWLPSATRYFVPWHADSLALEVLIERGLMTFAVMAALLALALARWVRCGLREGPALRAVLLAALIGWLCVGLVSSLFDVARVALLGCLLVEFGLFTRADARYARRGE